MVTVVVVTYNDYDTTEKYISLISNYSNIEHIVIVDNCSTDNSYNQLLKLETKKIHVIQSDRNGGYGYGNNFGIRYASNHLDSSIILISNSDIVYEESLLIKMEQVLRSNDDYAIVSASMKNIDKSVSLQRAWKIPTAWQYVLSSAPPFSKFVNSFYYSMDELDKELSEVDAVAGSMLLIKKQEFEKVGGYDEDIFLYCEETVLAIKMKKIKKKTMLLCNDFFIHEHSVSINKSINSIKRQYQLMWSSRKIILKRYYSFGCNRLMVVQLISKLSILFIEVNNKIFAPMRGK